MTPPLAPGHYAGDGHNHGGEVGHSHDHGHVHSPNESPDEHLQHMQEHQSAQGRVTLGEFHQAAQDTARLRAGRSPDGNRSPETRSGSRPNAESPTQRSTLREQRAQDSQFSSLGRDFSTIGNTRLFSAQGLASNSWLKALSFSMPNLPASSGNFPRTLSPRAENSRQGNGSPISHQEFHPGTVPLFSAKTEAPQGENSALKVLANFQQALQQAASSLKAGQAGGGIPESLVSALSALAEEALHNPELLRVLPESLQEFVAHCGGISPKALQVWLGSGVMALAKGKPDGWIALQLLSSAPGFLREVVEDGMPQALRGLAWMTGALGLTTPMLSRISPGMLQRLEKALMQFLKLLFARPDSKGKEVEEPLKDELLLQQLATMVAAEKKRARDKRRLKKKSRDSTAVQTKDDLEFLEEAPSEEVVDLVKSQIS